MTARVVVFGAGAIGCWVGARLARASSVVLYGRARVLDALVDGVRATDLDGGDVTAQPALSTDPRVVADADLVLVTVKSAATADAAATIAAHARPDAAIVSLQNGVRNARVLAGGLPQHAVVAVIGGEHHAP